MRKRHPTSETDAGKSTDMKRTDILVRLEELLKDENVLEVSREFRDLKKQYLELQDDEQVADNTEEAPITSAENDGKAHAPALPDPKEDEQIKEPEEALADTPKVQDNEVKAENKDKSENEHDAHEAEERRDEEEAAFQELVKKFEAKYREAHGAQEAEYTRNLNLRKEVLQELEALIQNEENIGRAFAQFNALRDKWRALGAVKSDDYRELQAEYNRLVELFFYNINIYKELKDHDLRHNLEEKQKIIEAQRELLKEDDVPKLELEVKINQEKWSEIGPTYREEWDKLKEEFWSITREIYKKIQDHYEQRKEEQVAHIEARKELIEKARHIASLPLKHHQKWREKTAEMIELQRQWEKTGYVPREEGEALWQEFRAQCDLFFDNKREHYDHLRNEQEANKSRKTKLVEKAESLQDSDDWKKTTQVLIGLQKEWKTIGPAHQRDENKLWRRFREACDHFFKAKKNHFSKQLEEEKQNLGKKEKLIEEIEASELSGNKIEDLEMLKNFSEQWRTIGFVPFAQKDRVNKAYDKAMAKMYDGLKIDRQEKQRIQFQEKLEQLKQADKPDRILDKERLALRSKINKLQAEIIQYENNMGFFANSKGAEKLIQEVEKKIQKSKNQIDELENQILMLNKVEDGNN